MLYGGRRSFLNFYPRIFYTIESGLKVIVIVFDKFTAPGSWDRFRDECR